MNRHHPYGGTFESPGIRRGGFSGPGPDRSHRYQDRGGHTRGRGFGRGRGSFSTYDGNMSHHAVYDQGSSQGDMGAYSDYDSQAASQESYYANNYGGATATQYPSAPANGYSQGYGKYEGALELETEIRYRKR
ncbi:hypothetical protein AX17_000662 [Amanita inopinata Kibby_2008]|nr:hypothetical protein AX17_000662 [Amanita inopinata Kibby_2008]